MEQKSISKSIVIGIDPGLSGTGWSVLKDRILVANGVVHHKEGSLEEKIQCIVRKLISELMENTPKSECHVYDTFIEYPAFHQSAGGEMVARRGDLIKLTCLTGWICGTLEEYATFKIHLVPVIKWKGTLPKSVTQSRVKKYLHRNMDISHHAYDAIGIAMYGQQLLQKKGTETLHGN